jgi:hypothetical protein
MQLLKYRNYVLCKLHNCTVCHVVNYSIIFIYRLTQTQTHTRLISYALFSDWRHSLPNNKVVHVDRVLSKNFHHFSPHNLITYPHTQHLLDFNSIVVLQDYLLPNTSSSAVLFFFTVLEIHFSCLNFIEVFILKVLYNSHTYFLFCL